MTQTSIYTCDICPAQGFPVGDETYPPGWVLVSIRSHYKKQVDDLDLCPVCAKGLAKAVRALTVNPPSATKADPTKPPQDEQVPVNRPLAQEPTREAPPDLDATETSSPQFDAMGLPEVAYEQPEKKS